MPDHSDSASDNFDDFARDYGKILDQSLRLSGATGDYFARNRVQWVKRLEKRDGRAPVRILDLGCGDGTTEVCLREAFSHASLHGVDVSAESIKVATERGLVGAEYRAYDGRVLPYSENEFDLVFMAGVLHHVTEDRARVQLVEEMGRVLKSGGSAYVFEQNPSNPVTRRIVERCPFDRHARLLRSTELRELMTPAPFADLETHFILFAPRHTIFAPVHAIEPWLTRIPLGAQYFVGATKR